MSKDFTRRRFLKTTVATGATLAACGLANQQRTLAAPQVSTKPTTEQRKLNIAIIGTGGRGMDHVREIANITNANVIAVCDTDALMLVNAARVIPTAQPHTDYREVLAMKNLEAVVVATPDFNHAYLIDQALRGGKHVYSEKPLCHTIKELRAIENLAAQTKLCTQMGIQIHALDNYRRVVEIIRAGAIGPVHEVHIWHQRSFRPVQNVEVPPPADLNYDLWLQPLPFQPFRKDYHPYNWREYWSLSEGMLGDIGCHLMDVAFWALDLGHATHVEAHGASQQSADVVPDWIVASYDFPARGDQPAVKLTWYDHPKHPEQLASWALNDELKKEAVMFVGEGGMLATNYTQHQLLPQDKFKDFKPPTPTIPSSPGHQQEWINACLANDPTKTSAPFSYGALLSEHAILGTIAYRVQTLLDWDHENLKFPNAPQAEKFLEYHYREGFEL